MGYTHSWFVNPQTPQQEWDKALDVVRPLVRLAAAEGVITGGGGTGEPSIEGDIWFNGRAEDDCDCETFYLPASMDAVRAWMLEQRWDPWGFFFCKTQRKPYESRGGRLPGGPGRCAWSRLCPCGVGRGTRTGGMTARYFPATVMGGRLHVSSGEGPWDSTRFDWWREDQLDLILAGGSYGEKVRTPEELEAVVRAPTGPTPTRFVWIHESLEGDARRMCEGTPEVAG